MGTRVDTDAPEHRSLGIHLRAEGDNRISGYAVTRERNSYWEVFVPGCFQNSLGAKSDRKPLVMGWLHTDPIGRWTEFREERDEGLYVAGKVSDTTLGRDSLTLVEDGAVTGLSIGFFLIEEQFVPDGTQVTFDTPYGQVTYQNDGPTFYVTEADVVEASLVMAPADDEARINRGAALVKQLPTIAPDAPSEDRERSLELLSRDRFAGMPAVRRRSLERALAIEEPEPDPEPELPAVSPALEREIDRFRQVIAG